MAARWKRRDQLACLGRRGPEGGDSDCPGKGGYPLPHWEGACHFTSPQVSFSPSPSTIVVEAMV